MKKNQNFKLVAKLEALISMLSGKADGIVKAVDFDRTEPAHLVEDPKGWYWWKFINQSANSANIRIFKRKGRIFYEKI
jgi:hypothetical protein